MITETHFRSTGLERDTEEGFLRERQSGDVSDLGYEGSRLLPGPRLNGLLAAPASLVLRWPHHGLGLSGVSSG